MNTTRLGLLVSLALGALTISAHSSEGPLYMETYSQTVLIRFTTPEAAAKASVTVAPLYHDLSAAFSSRWDDNHQDGARVKQVMDRFGQKGTFFLQDPKSWYQAAESGITIPGDVNAELPKLLLAGGNSIGGHTLSHEFMPALAKNRLFKEILGVRVEREVNDQASVTSFTAPFVSYQSELNDGRDRADIEETLRRSGYYQLGENRYNVDHDSGLFDAVFFAADGNEGGWGTDIQDEITRKRLPGNRPLFLITMHPWVGAWGGAEFPKLAAIYQKYSARKDWWYCNLNEYGCYRYQFRNSSVQTSVEGNVLRVTIVRPAILDLNDPTPLSLVIEGAPKESVESVTCASAAVEPFGLLRDASVYAFDLRHDRDRQLPSVYAKADNTKNASDLLTASKLPDIKAVLYQENGSLHLILKNGSAQNLHNIRVAFRLPLRWAQATDRVSIDDIPAGGKQTLTLPLQASSTDFAYTSDAEYDVAQIDFRQADRQIRLFATCTVAGPQSDASYPRDGFLVLGPLPLDREDFDLSKFAQSVMHAAQPAASYDLPFEHQRVAWTHPTTQQAAFLDPNIIWTTGKSIDLAAIKWDRNLYYPYGKQLTFILWSKVTSPSARTVHAIYAKACVKSLILNGTEINGPDISLRAGENDIRILYHPAANQSPGFSERAYGMQLRFSDASGQLVRDLSFRRPTL